MSANWDDLRIRLISAAVMALVGVLAIASGHFAFSLLLAVAGAVGLWELWSMARIKRAASGLDGGDLRALALYGLVLLAGIWGLYVVSQNHGRGLVLFLVGLVAITDTLGYFTGRTLGGPKFWPAISPKKTWSGILGGWVGAAILAALCQAWLFPDRAVVFVLACVVLSFASQLGDIAQSKLKRLMGVKDSSNIIPGHGGVLDRFDGLLAVGALAGLLSAFG